MVASNPTDLVPLREACRILSAHANSVRRWASQGLFAQYRIGAGQRRFSRQELLAYANGGEEIENEEKDNSILIYCRVSTSGQKQDLQRQIERTKDYCHKNYAGRNIVEFSDVGSGLNFVKPGLQKLIDALLNKSYEGSTLVIENKDRLCRWGFELIEQIAAASNINIVYFAQQEASDDELLAADLMAIIHVFSTKTYGKRAAERKKKYLGDATKKRAIELYNSGLSIRRIENILKEENHRYTDGSGPINRNALWKQCLSSIIKLQRIVGSKDSNSGEIFFAAKCKKAALEFRYTNATIWKHYCAFCKAKQLEVLNRQDFVKLLYANYRSCRIGATKQVGTMGLKISGITPLVADRTRVITLADFIEALDKSANFAEIQNQYVAFCAKKNLKPMAKSKLQSMIKLNRAN